MNKEIDGLQQDSKTRRMLLNIITLALVPVFFSGVILYRLGHPVLALIIGIPAAGFAFPTIFCLANALDEEDEQKRERGT